jgi:drug/metabolite transporter (DMT)-like permease
LLIISLFGDGLIPDFTAEVKDLYKPTAIQMLCVVNKWCALFSLIYLLVTMQIKDSTLFIFQHTEYLRDMFLMAICSFVGQIFIYRMVKTFKQHIVPFVTGTRRIVTVVISLLYFHHKTNIWQILSILVVFGVTVYELYDNITKT